MRGSERVGGSDRTVARGGAASGAAKTGGAEADSQCPEAKSVTTQRVVGGSVRMQLLMQRGEKLSKSRPKRPKRGSRKERNGRTNRNARFDRLPLRVELSALSRQWQGQIVERAWDATAASLQIGRGDRDDLWVVQILDNNG